MLTTPTDYSKRLKELKTRPGCAVLGGGADVYRYILSRGALAGRLGCFCMLNPSTADGRQNDPTVVRCCGFAAREGWDGFLVVNLYAYRATYQALLWGNHGAFDVVGADNDAWIAEAFRVAVDVVFAWGGVPAKALPRVARVNELAAAAQKVPLCLGTTAAGQPRHPLMLAKSTPLESWSTDRYTH